MKRSIFVILGLAALLSAPAVFAQEAEAGSESAEAFAIIPNLEPEETTAIEQNRTKASFKSNLKGCRIYLNHNFQGVTPLTLSNMVEGFYLLRTEKDGYNYQENFVYVEHGKAKTFYVELQPGEESKSETKTEQAQASAQTSDSTDDSLGDAK
ncbi:MAG: PEGA domain-containing protein [Treponema sp.]|uniref:PEGA domain-containing protein n=1 Tax=Treponema sp. TaxID=166 RepID=UPI0025EB24B6|nr:PEGA domain-containing protein [Treponema sp.]MBQ9622899.1 PEGA domain-containing protein [Treponema sp.]MBR0101187.1 PEGA domain-containing protein [Treponema sp.]MBR0496590.1 PEGA domain-containing protein [Treponema sp.]